MTHRYKTSEALYHLPMHMRTGMIEYIENGTPPGSFLEAVLSNDLKETFARADNTNRVRVFDFVVYLYNYAPLQCWGSRERYRAWVEHGGLNGTQKEATDDNT